LKKNQQTAFFAEGEKAKRVEVVKVAALTPEAERLLANFEVLAEAKNGSDQLRTLILTLAINGRLVLSADVDRAHFSTLPTIDLVEVSPLPELPPGWRWLRVDQVGDVKLGRQRSPQNHTGPNMRPYLRVANVHEARIDTSHVLEMNFTPDEVTRFALSPDDILLNEGQSYELVGRPAMYRGEIAGACFQNTLIRFRANAFTLPQYALIVFRAYLRNGRFRREAQQTTNMAHLSAGRLATIEFPLPPLAEQAGIIAKVDQLMALCDTLEAALRRAESAAQKLTEALVADIVA
jgi:type I restriction enzyme, S subunit